MGDLSDRDGPLYNMKVHFKYLSYQVGLFRNVFVFFILAPLLDRWLEVALDFVVLRHSE